MSDKEKYLGGEGGKTFSPLNQAFSPIVKANQSIIGKIYLANIPRGHRVLEEELRFAPVLFLGGFYHRDKNPYKNNDGDHKHNERVDYHPDFLVGLRIIGKSHYRHGSPADRYFDLAGAYTSHAGGRFDRDGLDLSELIIIPNDKMFFGDELRPPRGTVMSDFIEKALRQRVDFLTSTEGRRFILGFAKGYENMRYEGYAATVDITDAQLGKRIPYPELIEPLIWAQPDPSAE